MSLAAWLELILVVVLGTVGQVALKIALGGGARVAIPRSGPSGSRGARRMLVLWFASYLLTTVLWLHALRGVPLSQAFPILGLQYALIPLAARQFLAEPISVLQWFGIAVILAGVALVGQS